jgi:hypothetical protein
VSAPTVDAFVDELAHAVRGPVRVRRSLLREVHDGLTDAAEAHAEDGLDPAAAQARAVAEFGTVDELAELYQAELTVRRGRATALFVALVFPGMMLGWGLMWRAGVSWGPLPGPAEQQTVRMLSTLVDTASLVSAAVAVAIFGLTFVRTVPPRLVTVLAGSVAGAGTLATGGLSAVMNVVGGHAVGAALAAPGPALVAYAVSAVLLVLSLTISARTLRTALA